MTENKTPETFVVGETVGFYHMEDLYVVKVTAVRGNEVTIADINGFLRIFEYRALDKQYVALHTENDEDSPDIIFHLKNHAEL